LLTVDTVSRMFRVSQWAKNVLLFVPLMAAHRFDDSSIWGNLCLAFIVMGCVASAGYIFNDILDREHDREHPIKRSRPIASGDIGVLAAVSIAVALLLAGVLMATTLHADFVGYVVVYLLSTTVYSSLLKRIPIADCLALSGMYSLRILAGAVVATVPVSFWLMTFSMFIFTSLAFSKRYSEIVSKPSDSGEVLVGRGYRKSDAPLVLTLGVSSGMASILVLALYLNSEVVIGLYENPWALWFALPLVSFWVGRLWLQAHRGALAEDPVLYALRDRGSLITVGLLAVVFVLGLGVFPF
jgi:4-hydroxybenzoate polyprenyltransferase